MDFEETQKKDIMEAIKNNNLYDYIAGNYWRIEDDTLIQLLKECIYLLQKEEDTQTNKQLIENLKDFQGWED